MNLVKKKKNLIFLQLNTLNHSEALLVYLTQLGILVLRSNLGTNSQFHDTALDMIQGVIHLIVDVFSLYTTMKFLSLHKTA